MAQWTRTVGVASLAIVTATCAPPVDEVGLVGCRTDPAVEAQIAEVLKSHVTAHLEGNPVGAAAMYTDDVWIRLDAGAELRSRESLVAFYEELYSATSFVDLVYEDVETTVCGDAVHVVGQYSQTTEVGGQRTTERGQYMLLWRLQPDSSWKMWRGAVISVPAGA